MVTGDVRSSILAVVTTDEYQRLQHEYKHVRQCHRWPCEEILSTTTTTNISTVAILCSPSYNTRIHTRFSSLLFSLLARQTRTILFDCQQYLPYSNVIDYSHRSSSLAWLYLTYFQTFERRVQTLLAYLRTHCRLPTDNNEPTSITWNDPWTRHKDIYYTIHRRTFNFTRMPIGVMDRLNLRSDIDRAVQFESTFYDQWNRLYQPFYRPRMLTHPFESMTNNELYTIVILTHKTRFYQLTRLLLHLNGLLNLDRVLVLFNQIDPLDVAHSSTTNASLKDFLGDYHQYLPSIHVDIIYLFNLTNNLNNRFLPWNEFISTDCVLSLDDDVQLTHDEIETGFRTWKEHRARLVGFIARSHNSQTLSYESTSCSYSMILTGAAFIHRWYFDFYTSIMSEQIRAYVQLHMNCEDIAMNFLVSHLSRRTPMKVGQRQTFYCYKCETSLSSKLDHYEQRTECIKYFSNVYRSMPLQHSVYRTDRLPTATMTNAC
jgi:hypothetical protein